jgi:polysaccharide biosynthesis protein PslG
MRNFLALPSLCLGCILAIALHSSAQSAPAPMSSHPIAPTNWSFECVSYTSCGDDGSWIHTTSQPGTTRLWDSGTDWAILETGANTYKWTNLDTWLDLVAAHQPSAVMYTFGHLPCALASVPCGKATPGSGSTTSGIYWSPSPPKDLTASGSPSFNAFVTEITQHCSPAGHCVKDYIKYWEMWNEPNLYHYWSGTIPQLYEMFKPAIAIIRKNIPGAIVSTPPVSGGDTAWIASWMALENANGKLSNYFGFHSYLWAYTPETRVRMVERMVAAKNAAGWTTAPWMNTESNFSVDTDTCSTQYTIEDCHGQLVRWHVLQYAYQGGAGGAVNVNWYNWPSISTGGYDTYYYTMMQWLTGSTFTASCATVGNVWSCPLTEANGAKALIVWNPAGTSEYTPASGFIDYKEFNDTYGGATVTISNGQSTKIGLIPIMFETAK